MGAILDVVFASTLIMLISGNLFGTFGIDREKALASDATQAMTYIASKVSDICDNSTSGCPTALNQVPTDMMPVLPFDLQAENQNWIYTPFSSGTQNCFTVVGPGIYDQVALLGVPFSDGTYPTLSATQGNKAYLVFDSTQSRVYQVTGTTPTAASPSC